MPTPDEVTAALKRWTDANANDPKGEHYDTVQRIMDRELIADDYPRLLAERDKLQAWKDWVHQYLDTHSVPHHPPGPHGAEGRRIGDRMDWLLAERDKLAHQLQDCHTLLRDMTGDLKRNGAIYVDAYCGQATELLRLHG